jgi:hypothetical protein
MGLLNRLFKRQSTPSQLLHLPSGSFTLDRNGSVIMTTLPQSFPPDYLQEIGRNVLNAFQASRKANLPLSEIIVYYSTLRLLARELRGGAIVFLMPQAQDQSSS